MIDWVKDKRDKKYRSAKCKNFSLHLWTKGDHIWHGEVWIYAGRRSGYINFNLGPFESLKIAKNCLEEFISQQQFDNIRRL